MLNLIKQINKIEYKFLYIYILFFLLFISLFSFLFIYQSTKNEDIELNNNLEKNSIAPAFISTTLKGDEYILDFNNQSPTIITFWASWCPPCREELPILDDIHKRNKNIRILGVNMDANIDDAKKFVNQFNISFNSVIDKEFITISYGVSKIPETFFIDKHGNIKNRVSGKLTSDKINALIKNINELN
tara:strand:- start:176 stop:739 length:564 start_codon:yes stop_codon:yes gene_type:complete